MMPSIRACKALLAAPLSALLIGVSVSNAAEYRDENTHLARLDEERSRSISSEPAAHGIKAVDLTLPADDVWQRMRRGFAMPDLQDPLVTEKQAWYLNRPQVLVRTLERARRYLYHIVDEIEKRGLPMELALLPMVESAYNPVALSPAQAAGLWQFIPATGLRYGLAQNVWLDERRDIRASTAAALDYLQTIYEMHGDWHLALASYNWGEGAVARAIERNRAAGLPTDYLNLTLPAETRQYVPKLQAIKNIIANSSLFGLSLPTIPNEPYFVAFAPPRNMDLSAAARLADVPIEELRALNPGIKRPLIRADHSELVLPIKQLEIYLTNLSRAPEPAGASWTSHVLKPGERLRDIARRARVSLSALLEANGLTKNAQPKSGTEIVIPASTAAASAGGSREADEAVATKATVSKPATTARPGTRRVSVTIAPAASRAASAKAVAAKPARPHAKRVAKKQPSNPSRVAERPIGRKG
jgi:membrane-bound lytic murein transglycosylase D